MVILHSVIFFITTKITKIQSIIIIDNIIDTKNNSNRHGSKRSKWSNSSNNIFMNKIGFLGKYVANKL